MKNREKKKAGQPVPRRSDGREIIVVLVISCVMCAVCCSCTRDASPKKQGKVWTEVELNSLMGKTRDEVREMMGDPTGMLTVDAKGRWEYTNVAVSSEGADRARICSVVVYFSERGENRVTIVDIR